MVNKIMNEPELNLKFLEQIDNEINNLNPINILNDKEFDIILCNLATYLILVNNKILNPTNLFLIIISDKNVQLLCKELTGFSNIIPILKLILNRNPNLVKSIVLKKKSIKYSKKAKNGNTLSKTRI